MEKTFIVLKGEDGELYPQAFIARNDAAGKINAELYEKKMDEGESLVIAELKETH